MRAVPDASVELVAGGYALMAEGRTNAGIARRLWLTSRTVETHIASIMAKLDLRESEDEHRRGLAVLTWLGVRPGR